MSHNNPLIGLQDPRPSPERPSLPASQPPAPNGGLPGLVLPPSPASSRIAGRLRSMGLRLGVVAAVPLLLVVGAHFWPSDRRNPELPEILATVARANLPVIVTERGELESSKTVDVRCEVEGRQNKIVEIVPEGTRVVKNDTVVRFDVDELTRLHAEQAIKVKAAEGKAKAAKEELEVQKNKSESEVAKADLAYKLAELDHEKYIKGDYEVEVEDRQGSVELATKELEEAKAKLEQYRSFVKKGFGTPEQLRLREAEVRRTEYFLKRDKKKLEVLRDFTLKRQTEELTAKAKEAERELKRARSSGNAAVAKAETEYDSAEQASRLEKETLDRLQKQLDHCIVRAPQAGIVVYSNERYWDDESRIQAGATVHFQQQIFSLPDLTQMQVKVKIHESVVKKVTLGMKAEIRIDAYRSAVLHGVVDKIATLADRQGFWDESGVKEYVTVVKLTDLPTDAGLKPGMTAEVRIQVSELPDVLTVPVQAVTEREGQHYCYVVKDEAIERRPVKIGENSIKFVEVKEGLQEGEHVALDARLRMAEETKESEKTPGTPTSPKPEGDKPAKPTVVAKSG
jgi:RND family efflux transporter MFP subunit